MTKFVQLEVYYSINWKLTLDGVTREGHNEKMTLSPQTTLRSRHYYPIFQMSKLRLQVGQVSQIYTHNKQAVNLVGSYSQPFSRRPQDPSPVGWLHRDKRPRLRACSLLPIESHHLVFQMWGLRSQKVKDLPTAHGMIMVLMDLGGVYSQTNSFM